MTDPKIFEVLRDISLSLSRIAHALPYNDQNASQKYDLMAKADTHLLKAIKTCDQALSILASKPDGCEALEFAKFLEEHTTVIYEEKITLYRYDDFSGDGTGNYVLDDIYKVFKDKYEPQPSTKAENWEDELNDLLIGFMSEGRDYSNKTKSSMEAVMQFVRGLVNTELKCIKRTDLATIEGLINGSIRGLVDFGINANISGMIDTLKEIKSLLPIDHE